MMSRRLLVQKRLVSSAFNERQRSRDDGNDLDNRREEME